MEKCLDLALRKGKAGGEPKPTENKHFCKAVVRQTAGRRGATGRQNEELAHRADDTQQRKGSSRAVPPHFRLPKNHQRLTTR